MAAERWQLQMGVAQLSKGANQSFYHVLVDRRDRPGDQTSYVAEENLRLSDDWHGKDSGGSEPEPEGVEAPSPTPGIVHAELGKYFSGLAAIAGGGFGYEPNCHLQKFYPAGGSGGGGGAGDIRQSEQDN